MKQDIDIALDQCLIWLREGMDLQSCLARYPAHAEELRPLLELAGQLSRVVTPPPAEAARAAGQQRMLMALAQRRERQARLNPIAHFLKWMARSLTLPGPNRSAKAVWQVVAAALLAMLVLTSGAAVAASADSLPGDALYPVKLASQRVQLALPLRAEKRQLLEDRFNAQQRRDVQTVLREGRQVTVEFEGVLEEKEGDLWTVGGLPVTVQDTTGIAGQPDLGASVRVQGKLPGSGVLLATHLSVETDERPQPTEMSQPTRTQVAPETPEPAERSEPTETRKSRPSAEPTVPGEGSQPTDKPGFVETPRPGEAIEPADAPEPTETREADQEGRPVANPEPGETRDHEGTPAATETPEPEENREQEATPAVTETPHPGEEPDHDATPAVTETPHPGEERDHDATPAVTETPHPSEEPEHDAMPAVTRRTGDQCSAPLHSRIYDSIQEVTNE
jgi:hypothetical protein